MDNLTFTIELLKALAWPSATIVVAAMFRSELRILIGKMKKGRVGPAEFEFEQGVAILREEIKSTDNILNNTIKDSEIILAESEPRAAILNAWLVIQNEVNRLVKEKGLKDTDAPLNSISQRILHRELYKQPEYINMYNELKGLRYQAVHEIDFNPRKESVLSYIQLANELVSVLSKI